MSLRDRALDRSPVKSPAFNISLGTIVVLSLATVLTAWKDMFEFLFEDSTPGVRAAVLIATIAAIAFVVSADMLARALAFRGDRRNVTTLSKGWTAAIIQDGRDDGGYVPATLRAGADGMEFLIVKNGEPPTWYAEEKIALRPPAPPR